jgi:Leucine-rich repeat (LRR) protein
VDNILETRTLNLSGVAADRISSRIYDLVELRDLDLSDNRLRRVSPNIQYLNK